MCDREHLIDAYHDGELPRDERAAVEAHLSGCADCRDALEAARHTSRLFAGATMPQLPAGAVGRMYGAWAIGMRSARDRAVLRIASWLTAAAAVLVAGLIGLRNAPEPRGGSLAWDAPVATEAPVEATTAPELVQVAQWQAEDLSR